MYIDNENKKIIPSLPNYYKYTSNFNFLKDDDLKTFDVYKVVSFIEDDEYNAFTQILGTPYFNEIDISAEGSSSAPGENIKISLDIQATIEKICELREQTGHFSEVSNAISGTIIDQYIPVVENIKTFVYDDSESYIFICLGDSEVRVIDESSIEADNFKYCVKRTPIEKIPKMSLGDSISQESGFSGIVEFIDENEQVIKVSSCINIDKLNRLGNLIVGSLVIPEKQIYCYEIYRKVVSYGGEEWTPQENYEKELADKKILITAKHADKFISDLGIIVDNKIEHLIRNDHNGSPADQTRIRYLNNYGRYV